MERRLSPRRNTTINAWLAFGETALGCIIRDISDGGAKIEVGGVGRIPAFCTLLVPGHTPQTCKVAWRAIKEMGVQFVDAA